jgi:hypothetical protein
MHMAKKVPTSQHHTGVARPPEASGVAYVAGTRNVKAARRKRREQMLPEPRTPITEMAYDNVDHLVNSRRNSYSGTLKSAMDKSK